MPNQDERELKEIQIQINFWKKYMEQEDIDPKTRDEITEKINELHEEESRLLKELER